MSIVQLPVILSGMATRVDGSYTLKFLTRELGRDAAELLVLMNSEGWLLFAPNELKELDIPDEKADAMTGQKTQAQRLRGVIYRLYEQSGKQGDFETYYRTKMEYIIEFLKEKLN